jgi:hypothetical protein
MSDIAGVTAGRRRLMLRSSLPGKECKVRHCAAGTGLALLAKLRAAVCRLACGCINRPLAQKDSRGQLRFILKKQVYLNKLIENRY